MKTSKKAELTPTVVHTDRFSKLGIPTYITEVQDMACRKTTTKRAEAIAKHYAFHANAENT